MEKIVNVRKSNKTMEGSRKKKIIGVSLAGLAIGLSALIINNAKVKDNYKEPEYENTFDLNEKVIRNYEKKHYDYEFDSEWFYNPETGEIEKIVEDSFSR